MRRTLASIASLSVGISLVVLATTLLPERARAAGRSSSVGSVVAHVRTGAWINLHAAPSGAPIVSVGDRTEFGSPMTFGVVGRRGGWLAVVSSRLGNHRIGWVKGDAVRLTWAPVAVTIDLSARSLVVRRDGRVTERATVGIGQPGTPTPTGVFAVTDKLSGPRYGAYYGCCILALSGHQPFLPASWRGGDRIAIHGTNVPSTIGAAASAGCVRAADRDLRILMHTVPLGTKVVIRP
jgi:lipoprotein-anchoring transpeptidase ErfK/SrfK